MTINFQLRRIEEAAAPVAGQVFTTTSPTNGAWATPSSGAPTAAQYVTLAADATLTNERVLTAGTNITIVDGGAGGPVTINAANQAPVGASYVTLALNGTLTAERVLTAGNGVSIVDGGANGNVTLSSSPYVLSISGTLVNMVSTVAETDLVSVSVPANTLGANGCLDLQAFGDWLNNSGAGRALILRVYFGGVLIYQDTTGNIAQDVDLRAWLLRVRLANLNATNSQFITGEFVLSDQNSATTGIGDIGVNAPFRYSNFSGATPGTVNTTAAQTFRVTGQWAVSNASLSLRKRHHRLMVET